MGLKSVIIFSLQLLGIVLSKSVSKGNLQVEVTKEVKCKENQKAHEGDKVTVHYGGFLQDGNLLCLFLSINNSNSSQCAIYNVISLTLAEECGSLISWHMVQGIGHRAQGTCLSCPGVLRQFSVPRLLSSCSHA